MAWIGVTSVASLAMGMLCAIDRLEAGMLSTGSMLLGAVSRRKTFSRTRAWVSLTSLAQVASRGRERSLRRPDRWHLGRHVRRGSDRSLGNTSRQNVAGGHFKRRRTATWSLDGESAKAGSEGIALSHALAGPVCCESNKARREGSQRGTTTCSRKVFSRKELAWHCQPRVYSLRWWWRWDSLGCFRPCWQLGRTMCQETRQAGRCFTQTPYCCGKQVQAKCT